MSLKKIFTGLSLFAFVTIAAVPVSANTGGDWNKDWRGMHGKWDKDWRKDSSMGNNWRDKNNFRFYRNIRIRHNACDSDQNWRNWIGIHPGWNGIYW